MKQEFETYLIQTEMPSNVKKGGQELFDLYNDIFDSEIQDIFVEEYVDSEGSKEFKRSTFLFGEFRLSEIANFLFSDKLFIIPIKNNIDDIRIESERYYFAMPTDASKLKIKLTLSGGNAICDLAATKENCLHLKKLLKKFLYFQIF